MAKTILVVNRKGGVGKSMLTDFLCFAMDEESISYNLYDMDEQGGLLHKPVGHGTDEDLSALINIVDTPGALGGSEMNAWIAEADICIIPTRPTDLDLPALERTEAIIKAASPDMDIIYVVNGTNRFRATQDFLEYFLDLHKSDAVFCIPQSEVFLQARLSGMSPDKLDKRSPAALCMREFTNSVLIKALS